MGGWRALGGAGRQAHELASLACASTGLGPEPLPCPPWLPQVLFFPALPFPPAGHRHAVWVRGRELPGGQGVAGLGGGRAPVQAGPGGVRRPACSALSSFSCGKSRLAMLHDRKREGGQEGSLF